MELISTKTPSPWRVLLWKDVQQVRPVLTAVLASILAVQLLCVVAAPLVGLGERESLYDSMLTFTCLAPILCALGCSGMLIGHERQSGTWNWSSGLPMSWRASFASKLAVTLAGSLGLMLPLAIIPVFLVGSREFRPDTFSMLSSYATPLMVLVFFEVLLTVFAATLLMRETLTALVSAGVALIIFHLVATLAAPDFIFRWVDAGAYTRQVHELTFGIIQILFVILMAGLVLVRTYRWRWGVGQQAVLRLGFRQQAIATYVSQADRSGMIAMQRPSEWRMLLSLAWRTSLGMRLSVLAGTLLTMLWLATRGEGVTLPPLLMLLGVAALFFGVSVFEGDQTQGRYRFLADRGAEPRKLFWSRLLPPLLIYLATAVFGLSLSLAFGRDPGRQINEDLIGVAIVMLSGAALFLTGAFSSLCFRNSTIAAVVAAVTSLAAIFLTSVLATVSRQLHYDYPHLGPINWLLEYTVYWSPVTPLILLLAIRWLVPRWMVWSEPRLHRHYPWVVGIAGSLPVLLAATSGFLGLPNGAWTGMSAVVSNTAETRLPLLAERDSSPPGGNSGRSRHRVESGGQLRASAGIIAPSLMESTSPAAPQWELRSSESPRAHVLQPPEPNAE